MLRLPTPDTVTRLMSGLLGVKVGVVDNKVDDTKLVVCGVFASAVHHEAAFCLLDIPFGAAAGAALSMMPADVAKEYVKKGKLDEDILDNCAEVLNVCSRLFTSSDAHRVTLTVKTFHPEPIPAEVKAALASSQRLNLNLSVDRYGGGALVLIIPG